VGNRLVNVIVYTIVIFIIFVSMSKILIFPYPKGVSYLTFKHTKDNATLSWRINKTDSLIGFEIYKLKGSNLKQVDYVTGNNWIVPKKYLVEDTAFGVRPIFENMFKMRGSMRSVRFIMLENSYYCENEIDVFDHKYLKKPLAIVGDNKKNYYLADSDNNRVIHFNYDGEVTNVSERRVEYPSGVLVAGQDLLILQGLSNIIQKIDSNGKLIQELAYHPEEFKGFGFVSTWTIDNQNTLFILDWINNVVVKLSSDLVLKTTIKTDNSKIIGITSIGVDSKENIFIVDSIGESIYQFVNGKPVKQAFEKMVLPVFMYIDKKDNFYIVDKNDFLVKKYDKNRKLIAMIGGINKKYGQIIQPASIYANENEDVFIVDLNREKLIVYKNNR